MRDNFTSILFKRKNLIVILTLIYLYNFNKLGNTLIRTNSEGNSVFAFLSILESFIGPVRSLIILLRFGDINQIYELLKFEMTNIASPYLYILMYFIVVKMGYSKDSPYSQENEHNNYILLDINT